MAIQKITRATKPSNPSPDSAPGAQQAPRTPPAPAPTPFFPYARYTSLVGVHASLLAFTAIFLPRSAFADFSSPAAAAQKRKDPLVLMTESPARSLAWMCLGCLVLQLWWAGWIREWRLEATLPPIQTAEDGSLIETESQKAERILKQKQWDRQKANVRSLYTKHLAPLISESIIGQWLCCPSDLGRLCGLPCRRRAIRRAVCKVCPPMLCSSGGDTECLCSHVLETYMLSLLLAVLTVYPSVYALGLPSLKADTDALVRRMAWVRLYAELSWVFLLCHNAHRLSC